MTRGRKETMRDLEFDDLRRLVAELLKCSPKVLLPSRPGKSIVHLRRSAHKDESARVRGRRQLSAEQLGIDPAAPACPPGARRLSCERVMHLKAVAMGGGP